MFPCTMRFWIEEGIFYTIYTILTASTSIKAHHIYSIINFLHYLLVKKVNNFLTKRYFIGKCVAFRTVANHNDLSHLFLAASQESLYAESIEWFIEDQAFFLANVWFGCLQTTFPHLPRQQDVSLFSSSCVSPVKLGERGWARSQIRWQ